MANVFVVASMSGQTDTQRGSAIFIDVLPDEYEVIDAATKAATEKQFPAQDGWYNRSVSASKYSLEEFEKFYVRMKA